ncbi:hypothetical protein BS50DRAFT_362226 [Corynespora cassiicola Philippines]|uniref:Uncharacterized protein n=1 Tax=Corynespora cassiicola Philippines TaxID=1448308 RepID=A0A2T2NTH3_CORCC|nr:hypothetical protein BS50DRAFT_362226 [Corynespora cassiicola Philippines]
MVRKALGTKTHLCNRSTNFPEHITAAPVQGTPNFCEILWSRNVPNWSCLVTPLRAPPSPAVIYFGRNKKKSECPCVCACSASRFWVLPWGALLHARGRDSSLVQACRKSEAGSPPKPPPRPGGVAVAVQPARPPSPHHRRDAEIFAHKLTTQHAGTPRREQLVAPPPPNASGYVISDHLGRGGGGKPVIMETSPPQKYMGRLSCARVRVREWLRREIFR